MARRRHDEWDFQKVAFAFMRKALPAGSYVRSVDTAQKGSSIQRIKDYERGIRSLLDMEFLVLGFPPGKIELKVGDNTSTSGQDQTAKEWAANGGVCWIAYTLDEVEAGLRQMGIPLSATAGGKMEAAIEKMEARKGKKRSTRVVRPRPTAAAIKKTNDYYAKVLAR